MADPTNFDVIRKEALELMEESSCPELAKEFLIKAIADEQSLMTFLNTTTIMAARSSAFAGALERAMEIVDMKRAVMKILSGIMGEDMKIQCMCDDCCKERGEE